MDQNTQQYLQQAARKMLKAQDGRIETDAQMRHLLDGLSFFHSAVSSIVGVTDDQGAADPDFTRYEKRVRQYLEVGTGFAEEPVDA